MSHPVDTPKRIPWKLVIALTVPLLVAGLFLAAISHASSPRAAAIAAGSMGEEFPIVIADGAQYAPKPVHNPSGNEYLILYAESDDVAALRLQADGSPTNDPFVVAVAAGGKETAVTFNVQAGEYLAVWTEYVDAAFDWSVYGQRISAAGELVDGRIDVAVRPGRQRTPGIATCGNEYLVVWDEDLDHAWPWSFHIYGRRVSTGGVPVGDVVTVSTGGAQQITPDVVCNPTNDEYLAVWRDARNSGLGSGTNDDIYGQRLSCAGERLLAGDLAISTQFSPAPGGNAQNDPAAAYNSKANEYLVVWHDERDDPDASTRYDYLDVYGQVVSGDGITVGVNLPIAVAGDNQWLPDVAYSPPANQYLVVWQDHRGGDADIYARRVSGRGTLLGEEIVVSDAPGDQLSPAVAYNEVTRQFLIVWEDRRNPATGADVYGRLYRPPEVYLPLIYKAV